MVVLSLLASLLSANVTLHPESPGVAIKPATLQGLPLCVWNDASLFTKLKGGMKERGDHVFRFPNGSYSDIYHWNGSGSYNADSVWAPDNAVYKPGFAGGSVHRGITTGSDFSLIDDGDLSTYWWSNPEHSDAPGWFMTDLAAAKSVDSLALWLGTVRPDSVQVLTWNGGGVYPVPMQQMSGSKWTELARLKADSLVTFKPSAAFSSQYVAVRPIGALANGWQVREFKLLKAGVAVTKNVASGATQTTVYAASTHPAGRWDANRKFNWDFEAYMAWMKNYPGSVPLVCVNYGTGTAQEAAAWVHYANKVKNYGIKRWQIGNESSGSWEEAGCVTARQYATRFVKYAQAMKAEDPTIEIEGPVLAGVEFVTQASGDYDGRSWMEGFLRYVDSAEKATGTRLVDGIDFHNYPYWFTSIPSADAMMASTDGNGAQYDSLIALMGRTISDPTSRQILMTEFNTSTQMSSLAMTASAGTAAGLQFAHFVNRFGDRGLTNLWELYTGIVAGPDGTYGSLSALVVPTQGEWSSLGYAPNASFWSTRTIMNQWLDPAGGDTVIKVDPVTGVRLFAVRNNGRVSVLAMNLDADTASITLDAASFPNGGDVLSWGTGEYSWNGTDADARAIPNNGPSSKTFASGWTGTVKVPPYGMAVVRGAGRAVQAPHTGHWLLSNTKATVTDSVIVSGWTAGEGSKLTGGTWTAGAATGTLQATDGAWDGPSESWTAKIAAADLGEGSWNLKIAVNDDAKNVVADSTSLIVTGTQRAVLLVADFEKKKAQDISGTPFYAWTADAGVVDQTVEAYAGGYYLKDSIDLIQPTDLGYTTLFNTQLAIKNAHVLDSTFHLAGILFDIRTTHSSKTGNFVFESVLSSVKDYQNYSIALPNTKGAWVRDTILFNDLSQPSWAKQVPFELDSLTGFAFSGHGAGQISLSLDNIYLIGTTGTAINTGIKRAVKQGSFALAGRDVTVDAQGAWTLRLVSADGRLTQRWNGTGAAVLSLPRTVGPHWAVLEGEGTRRILAIPSVMR